MAEQTDNNPKIVAHLIDMDSADKKLIPIPDMTLVKMKEIFFFFAGGRIYHSREGFDMFPHKDKIRVRYDFAELARRVLLEEEMYKTGYCGEIHDSDTIFDEFDMPRGNK